MFYDIITDAMARMQIDTHWENLPWKRCQAYVKSGTVDAMITVPTTKRMAYALTHTTPFYLKKMVLFTYQGHPRIDEIREIRSLGDIREKGLSVITYHGNGWHQKHVASKGIPGVETAKVHLVWKMLAARRGDLVIEWPVGAYAGMDRTGVRNQIVEIGVAVSAMEFHLLISKKSAYAPILDRFNRIIIEMLADGTIDDIVSAYY